MDRVLLEREIGQQLMTVRIIQQEIDIAIRGGISFLSMEKLAEWTQKSEDEIDSLISDIKSMDEFYICVDAANKYAEDMSADAQVFFFSTFRKHGYHYIDSILGNEALGKVYSDKTESLAEINAMSIIEKGVNVEREIQSAMRFKDSLDFYFDFYIKRIIAMMKKGYDWDVVKAMLRENDDFTDLLKVYVDKHSA